MTYQPTWINRLAQFDTVQYDVIYDDDEQVLPQVRLTKIFPVSEDTADGLAALAETDISAILYSQQESF